jgi:cell division protein FtsA
MSRHTLAEVVEPRYQELFELAFDQIRQSGLEDQIAAGIVLTGGTAKMEGAVNFAEHIFQMPVRLGSPMAVTGLVDYVNDPTFSTAVGLLIYGKDSERLTQSEAKSAGSIGQVFKRISSWFKGEF